MAYVQRFQAQQGAQVESVLEEVLLEEVEEVEEVEEEEVVEQKQSVGLVPPVESLPLPCHRIRRRPHRDLLMSSH